MFVRVGNWMERDVRGAQGGVGGWVERMSCVLIVS